MEYLISHMLHDPFTRLQDTGLAAKGRIRQALDLNIIKNFVALFMTVVKSALTASNVFAVSLSIPLAIPHFSAYTL